MLVLLFCAILFAEDVFDIAEKYNQQKNQVQTLEEKRRSLLAEIYSIEKETEKVVIKKAELDEKSVQLNSRLKKISRTVIDLEKDIYKLTPVIAESLAFVDQLNELPWFYAFLNTDSLHDFDQLYKLSKNINETQSKGLIKYFNLHENLKKEQQELRKTAKEILTLRKKIISKETVIAQNQRTKGSVLKRLEHLLDRTKKRLHDLQGQGRRAVSQSDFKDLGLLFGTQFFDKKGMLKHPLDGPIIQGFGLNKALEGESVEIVHKGLFYASLGDKNVKVIADGRIRFNQDVAGFGKVIIVDHGSRYYSVYGNLKNTKLKNGSILKQSDVVGQVGHNHLQFGQGLYFEIRHFSEPQDPLKWLVNKEEHLATL